MKEADIRKPDVFNKYLELVRQDTARLFNDKSSFAYFNCFACGSDELSFEFEKNSFRYVSCKKCLSLLVNPRPSFESLKKFYANSASATFFANEFFKPVAEIRKNEIFRPRALYISKFLNGASRKLIGDIGAGFGLFLEELRAILPNNKYIAIEPSIEMAAKCREKGLDTKCVCFEELENAEGKFDLLSAFELIEHLYNPVSFLNRAYSILKPGGFLFLTTLNVLGFDILLLWEKSKSLTPPHHLNFFNPNSLEQLLKRLGFKVIEISTPGKLDWDIVEGMIKNENVVLGRFWNLLAKRRDDVCKNEFQDWIAKNNLSSHMRILAQK